MAKRFRTSDRMATTKLSRLPLRFAQIVVTLTVYCVFSIEGHAQIDIEWGRQFGSRYYEVSRATAFDGVNAIYVAGITGGDLGAPHEGGGDLFLWRFDQSGSVVWRSQIGSEFYDVASCVAADTLGNVFVGGRTGVGPAARTVPTMFKFNSAGLLQWTQLVDDEHHVSDCFADGLGNVFTVGVVQNGSGQLVLRRFSSGGVETLTDIIPPPADGSTWRAGLPSGARASDGTIAISAYIYRYRDELPISERYTEYQVLVAKLDSQGQVSWSSQFGPPRTINYSVATAVDSQGSVYVVGVTSGSLGGINPNPETPGDFSVDHYDTFVRKFSPHGDVLWTRQIGSELAEFPTSVHVDASFNVIVTGTTYGTVASQSAGKTDVFVAKYNPSGTLVALEQFGSDEAEFANDAVLDTSGHLFVTGLTWGSYLGPNLGDGDAFLFSASTTQSPLPGDANGDGQVTPADYLIWATSYGDCGVGHGEGNFNGDACITAADYTLWADNFPLANPAAVPEPATCALTSCGALLLLFSTRRMKRLAESAR